MLRTYTPELTRREKEVLTEALADNPNLRSRVAYNTRGIKVLIRALGEYVNLRKQAIQKAEQTSPSSFSPSHNPLDWVASITMYEKERDDAQNVIKKLEKLTRK